MKKILVVVDMQNDFITGSLGNKECEAVVPEVINVLNRGYDEVYVTQDTHYDNYLDTQEGKKLPVVHCIKETKGWELNPQVEEVIYANYTTDKIHKFEKPAFGNIELANVIKQYCTVNEEVIIDMCGVCTGICVMSNAIILKSAVPQVPINVIEKACACVTPDSHNTAIEAMKLCQINII